jgi:hypothetical protein
MKTRKPTQKSIIIEPIIDYVGNDGQNLIYSLFTPNISEEKDLMSSDSMQMKTISQPKFIKNSQRFNRAFGTQFSDAFSSFGKSFGSGFGTEFSRGYKNNNKNKKFGNTFKSKSNARLFGSNLNIGFKPFINVFRNLNK